MSDANAAIRRASPYACPEAAKWGMSMSRDMRTRFDDKPWPDLDQDLERVSPWPPTRPRSEDARSRLTDQVVIAGALLAASAGVFFFAFAVFQNAW